MKVIIIICIAIVFFLFCIFIGIIMSLDDGILTEYDKAHLTKKEQEEAIIRYQEDINWMLRKHAEENDEKKKLSELIDKHREELVNVLYKEKDSRV